MRSLPTSIAVVMLLTGSLANAKTFRAERYDVQLQLDNSGGLAVTETVKVRFGDGPFKYFFRDIAATETDGISDVRASMDGRQAAADINGDDPVKVRWNFGPLENETHTFVLQYWVAGVLRKDAEGQAVIWRALPPRRSYRIDASDVTLVYPQGIRLLSAGVSRRQAGIFFAPSSVTAKMSRLDSVARPVFRAQFPADAFAVGIPRWQQASESRRKDFLEGMKTGAAVAAPLVVLAVMLLFRMRGSDWAPRSVETPVPVTQPPAPLGPALAAQLAGSQHGAVGVLFDLARRGVVRIEQVEKRWFGSPDFRVVRDGGRDTLAPHEQAYLELMFPHGETETVMSKAGRRVASKWARVSRVVTVELSDRGLLDVARKKRRSTLLRAGLLGVALACAVIGLGFATHQGFASGATVTAGFALLMAAIAFLVGGATVSIWTEQGGVAAAQWRRFRGYLKELGRGKAAWPGQDAVDRLLPYGAAFGVAQALLKRQGKQGERAIPAWFQALDGADFAAFVAFAGAADSGAGAGAASGAGASGGGASGAG